MGRIIKNWDEFKILNESSLSRIWQHIEGDKSFGVISPYRKDNTDEENIEKYKELKKEVIQDGYGYIEMIGGYIEEGYVVEEKSILIPNISKDKLMELGIKYDQFSVIYKDKNEFIEIGTNNISGIGEIVRKFVFKGWDKNLITNPETVKEIFSYLLKGSHKNVKFLFNIKECYLYEVVPFSFNEIAYHKDRKQNLIKLL